MRGAALPDDEDWNAENADDEGCNDFGSAPLGGHAACDGEWLRSVSHCAAYRSVEVLTVRMQPNTAMSRMMPGTSSCQKSAATKRLPP